MSKTFILPLCGELNWDVAERVANEIYKECLPEPEPFKRVVVMISTPGGDVDAAWAIHSTLRSITSDLELVTVANGRIYSAGSIVFLAGDKRCVYHDTLFLFHPTTISIKKDEERARYKVAEELKDLQIDEIWFKNLLKNRLTKATKYDIKKLSHANKSLFLDSKEAMKLGLATHLVKDISDI